METLRGIFRTKSSWGYVLAALCALVAYLIPIFGVVSFVLAILTLILQGVESQRLKKELDDRHASLNKAVAQAKEDATTQHTQAMQEIKGARTEANAQHAVAMLQIDQERREAVAQWEQAGREIRKVGAERFLLQAEEMAVSLLHRDALVQKAIEMYPDFRRRELRKLGKEMSAAVLGNVDPLKEKSTREQRHHYETIFFPLHLDAGEKTFFLEHATSYLEETELQVPDPDAAGLAYLACMYGCLKRYDDMLRVLEKAEQIKPIMQVMEEEYRKQFMLFTMVDACDSDPSKIQRLREVLALPQMTEQYFNHYMTEVYPLNPKYSTQFSNWVAIRKPEAPGEKGKGSAVLTICPPWPPEKTTYATLQYHGGASETVVSTNERVSLADLYIKLSEMCILFCPYD